MRRPISLGVYPVPNVPSKRSILRFVCQTYADFSGTPALENVCRFGCKTYPDFGRKALEGQCTPNRGAMYPRGLRGSSVPRGPGYTGPGYSTPEREEVYPFGRWVGDLERRRSVLFWVVCVKGSTIYRIFGCYPHLGSRALRFGAIGVNRRAKMLK